MLSPRPMWTYHGMDTLKKKKNPVNQNTNIFIQEHVFEYVVCKMAAILFRPQWAATCSCSANSLIVLLKKV